MPHGANAMADPYRREFAISPQLSGGKDQPAAQFTAGPPNTINPLPYPLDGLLLYFLFSRAEI
jgi:hypothetical protein